MLQGGRSIQSSFGSVGSEWVYWCVFQWSFCTDCRLPKFDSAASGSLQPNQYYSRRRTTKFVDCSREPVGHEVIWHSFIHSLKSKTSGFETLPFECLKSVISNVDCLGQKGKSLLHIAAGTKGKEEIVQFLVRDCGADVNKKASSEHHSPGHFKLQYPGNIAANIKFTDGLEGIEEPQTLNPWVPEVRSIFIRYANLSVSIPLCSPTWKACTAILEDKTRRGVPDWIHV